MTKINDNQHAAATNPRILLFRLIVPLLIFCGCQEQAEIRQYKIAKSRSDLGNIGMTKSVSKMTVVETRMVVAIAEREDSTWFLKLTGPSNEVAKYETEWKSIFESLRFDNSDKPQWDAPKAWTLGPAKPMRFATLVRNTQGKKLEISISSLGPNQDMLHNANRWLGQLTLPDTTQEKLEFKNLTSAAGPLKIFDAVGTMEVAQSAKPEPTENKNYVVPKGWSEGSSNQMVAVRLLHVEGDETTQISVTKLMAAANEWLPNAQRWARQVNQPETVEFINSNTKDVQVDGVDGKMIELVDEEADGGKGLIAVMIIHKDLAWFFKMFGTKKQTAKLKSDFIAFLNSYRFSPN